MILAKLAGTNSKLLLNSLADAEALLRICAGATLLRTTYDETYAYPDDGEVSIAIEIRQGYRIVTVEEHEAIQAKIKAKEAAKAAQQ